MASPIQVARTLRMPATVRNPQHPQPGVPVRLRIDTGAEMAVLDRRIAQRLGLVVVATQTLQGVAGRPQSVPIYRVTLDLGSRGTLTNVQVAGLTLPPSAQAEGLFGDNLLRQGILIYNGPRNTWSFQLPPPQ